MSAERKHGKESVEVAAVLDVMADARRAQGQYGKDVADLAAHAVKIRERRQGPAHADVASSLVILGSIAIDAGEYEQAKASLERALAIREQVFGPEHIETARVLHILADVANRTGQYHEALTLGQRALPIYERTFGPEHPELVTGPLMTLALNYMYLGDYAASQATYQRLLTLGDSALPANSAERAWIHNNYGSLMFEMGDYEAGRPHYEMALSSLEQSLGPEHPDVAWTLLLLANLLADAGNYEAARPCYERAIAINEKTLGPEHPELAASLFNYSTLLTDMGDWATAIPITRRSLEIREKALGSEHPYTAYSIAELAREYELSGNHAESRRLFERTLELRERSLGHDHPQVAQTMDRLAHSFAVEGKLQEAQALADSSLAIRERAFGPEHLAIARSLTSLGFLARRNGDPATAARHYERAATIISRSLGPTHPDIISPLQGLIYSAWDQGITDAALSYALRTDSTVRILLDRTMSGLSERQALRYASFRGPAREAALALATVEPTPDAARRVWDAIIRGRGQVLEEMATRHRSAVQGGDSTVTEAADSLATARRKLGANLVRGPVAGVDNYRATLDSLRRICERLENRLASLSPTFDDQRARKRIGFEEVAHALPAKAALVAYAAYEPSRPQPMDSKKPEPGYLAFVLLPDRPPSVVPLGGAALIESLFVDWSRQAGRRPADDDPTLSESRYRRSGEALRRALWDPIAAKLSGVSEVFVIPDGVMQVVNLGTLPSQKDCYLVEDRLLIHLLTTERDLIPTAPVRGVGLLAVGNPDFDSSLESQSQLATATGQAYRGRSLDCQEFASVTWDSLPGTGQEVSAIMSLWREAGSKGGPGHTITGTQASESEFKSSAPGHQIIHVATHGFFFEGTCATSASGRGIGALVQAPPTTIGTQAEVNPLLLSGLVFAGANHRTESSDQVDDGILTAEEIASLDLSGTDWAVLSACETGAGKITRLEGVFGMRRAFQVAGVRTVVMSLWPVEDDATRDWMSALYEARLHKQRRAAEATREASRSILRERRKHQLSTHPFYWGAFVACGVRE